MGCREKRPMTMKATVARSKNTTVLAITGPGWSNGKVEGTPKNTTPRKLIMRLARAARTMVSGAIHQRRRRATRWRVAGADVVTAIGFLLVPYTLLLVSRQSIRVENGPCFFKRASAKNSTSLKDSCRFAAPSDRAALVLPGSTLLKCVPRVASRHEGQVAPENDPALSGRRERYAHLQGRACARPVQHVP